MFLAVLATLSFAAPARAQSDWPYAGHDPGAQRFSPLKQINAKNVTKLRRAWTFHTGDAKDDANSEGAPLMIDGVLYFDAGKNVYALDPVTGLQIWKFETKGTRPRGTFVLARRREHSSAPDSRRCRQSDARARRERPASLPTDSAMAASLAA